MKMAKEIVKYANFRSLIVPICVAVSILTIHYIYTSTSKPKICTHPSQETFSIAVDSHSTSKHSNVSLNILYVEENLESLDQKNLQLIQYTRVRHLTPPSKLPYNLEGGGSFKDTFSGWIAEFFDNKRNGVFIEAGAHKGEKASHTLYLEKELGWTGLLVECNPTVVPYLRSKHRKAWIADVCLSPTTNPGTLNFSNPTNWTFSGTTREPWDLPVPTDWTFFDVQAIPLYTILAALGLKEIDYFSFDIEGQELSVLRNFPFELVIFKVIVVEVMFYTPTEVWELDNLLKSNGYWFVKNLEVDKVYVHQDYKEMIP